MSEPVPVELTTADLLDLVEAVALSLLLRLESYGLASPPPQLARQLDAYLDWLPTDSSEPSTSLSEWLRASAGGSVAVTNS